MLATKMLTIQISNLFSGDHLVDSIQSKGELNNGSTDGLAMPLTSRIEKPAD
jgi:hypothetical protein